MDTKKLGAVLTGISMLIGAAAGIKAIASPTSTTQPQAATAIGGSTSVVGSGNTAVTGSGNTVVSGSANGAAIGNSTTVFSGPVTNNFAPQAALVPRNVVAEQLHGRWKSDYAFPTETGFNQVNGYTTFLQNGAYTFQGTQTVRAKAKGSDVVIVWAVSDAGRWDAHNKLLTVQSSGMRTSVVSMAVDGVPVDMAKLVLLGMPQPRLEDYVAPNVATEFSLMSVSSSELHLEALAPTGSKFAVTATRQTKA